MMKFPIKTFLKRNFFSAPITYEIPEEYHNSFYLANATLLQIVNYFIHSSYKVVFPELLQKVSAHWNCSERDAEFKIRTCIHQMERCDAVLDVHIPMRRFHGGVDAIRANRVYHGMMFHDKCLGGLRFDGEIISRHNSQGFAAQQTYRNALFGIDMGGAAGGIKYCPYVLNAEEMQDVLGNFMARIPKFSNFTDLMEPDVGTTSIEMDILKSYQGVSPHVEILGKSAAQGGLTDHVKAGGKCTLQSIKRFLQNEKISKRVGLTSNLEGKTYILQGLGKTGKQIALMMHREGAECIGVREHDCVLYEPGGIHIKALFKHMTKFGTMRQFNPKCREYDLDSIFTQPCDILILSALERCISCAIADRVQAKVLVEVANLPISPTAYRILTNKEKLIIPGLLAGAGPSLMSYYEYCVNSGGNKIDPQNVASLFTASMQTAIDDIIQIEEKLNLKFNFLQAAYVRAIRHLFKRLISHQLMQQQSNQKMFGMQ